MGQTSECSFPNAGESVSQRVANLRIIQTDGMAYFIFINADPKNKMTESCAYFSLIQSILSSLNFPRVNRRTYLKSQGRLEPQSESINDSRAPRKIPDL